MQIKMQPQAQQKVVESDPCDKVIEINESSLKKIFEANRPNPFKLKEEELQAKAKNQQNFSSSHTDNAKMKRKATKKVSQNSKQLQGFQYRCFLKKLKPQCNKQRLCIPSVKDALFCHQDFMKKNKINFAKARRLQKEVTNLILLNSFQLKAMPLPEQLQQSDQQLKEQVSQFYEEETEKVKKYFPEDYEHIFALSTATGRMTIKKRKKNDEQ